MSAHPCTEDPPYPPIRVSATLELLAPVWPFIQAIGREFSLPVELLLAIGCVETAGVRRPNGVIFMSNQAMDCMARWYLEMDPNPVVIAELAYAGAHLHRQCRRFGRLTLALAAFRFDPEWVADHGEAVFDQPEARDYVRQVLATMTYLCDDMPWRYWDACPRPDLAPQPKGNDRASHAD
jgi:hypothetical protein